MANFSFGFDLPGHEDTEIELDDMETKPTQLIREEGPIDSDHPAIEVLCPVMWPILATPLGISTFLLQETTVVKVCQHHKYSLEKWI